MERILVKTAIYTCITSFSLLLVLIDRVRVVKDEAGEYSGEASSYPDYFLMLLRYSILVTFIVVIIVFLIKLFKKSKGQKLL
ncbi:hypothetical protein ACWF7H_29090 [Peribacillus butanolivorans]|uniref:hypothetical protein n=1 Tax=Peribacillus butanolivorans TaxID=421767 RepID=UPI0036BE17BB